MIYGKLIKLDFHAHSFFSRLFDSTLTYLTERNLLCTSSKNFISIFGVEFRTKVLPNKSFQLIITRTAVLNSGARVKADVAVDSHVVELHAAT